MIVRILAVSCLLAGSATLLLPQKAENDDVILRAMRDELDRSRQLRQISSVQFFVAQLHEVHACLNPSTRVCR